MLEVRKPFSSSDFEEEEKKIKKNEEEEEKPVESTNKTTEETHGGEESTESIEDSENPSSKESKNEQQTESEQKENEEEEEKPVEPSQQNNEETHEGSESTESIQNSENPSENENEKESSSAETESENPAENEDQSSSSKETENENAAENESEEQAENPVETENEESKENENEQQTDENDEDQSDQYSHTYNTEEVVDINANEKRMSAKYFATEFWRFIESFAEEKTKIYINTEAEEYNVKKLMFRAYERKPLNAYMQKRVRETVILILDNSGSMSWWFSNLRMLASLALEKKDVEIYIAPNGEITAQLTKNGRISVSHDKFMKAMSGRKIIYVGDFDGGDTAIELSWSNDVVWICPEDRYRRFLSHDWLHYDESKFHGVFIRAFKLEEMFEGLRRITRLNRLFIDLHEDWRFSDDSYY
jgi:hypothetical protein